MLSLLSSGLYSPSFRPFVASLITFPIELILLYGIICTLFIGFRYQIGGDWGIYDNWARLINTIDFIENQAKLIIQSIIFKKF